MDKLEEIFRMQGELDEMIRSRRFLAGSRGFSPEEWIQKKGIALIEETTEVLNEVHYKWWKNPKPVNYAALHEELIDVLHFWVSMCLDAGLDPEKAYEIYVHKNRENRARQEGKSAKPDYCAEEK